MKKLISLTEIKRVTGDDNNLLKEIIHAFTIMLSDMIEKINEACKEKNTIEVKNIAHKMKSSLTYFGMNEQRSKAHDIETCVETDFPKASGLISEITSDSTHAIAELNLILKEMN